MTITGEPRPPGRWLVTGAGGMLGQDMVAALRHRGDDVTGLGRPDLDVADEGAVQDVVCRFRPAVVVNCAAWTAVDEAEDREEEALAVNGRGAANVAAACARSGARLVHVSTDYVFRGDGRRPYAEDDPPAPRTAYGRTKLAGERAVLSLLPDAAYVVRTAWLYGAHGQNFVSTMIRLAGQRPTVDVVADQRGQPTWTADVAAQVIALADAGAAPGIYHGTSSGETTWFGLAQEVFGLLGTSPSRVRPVASDARLSGRRSAGSLAGLAAAGLADPQASHVGHAVRVVRKQPRGARFRQRGRRGVLVRKDRRPVIRPVDREVRVERVHAMLAGRGVGGGTQVEHGGLVT
jgi:dTDP-4-dehydrorhamnose reductase